MKRKRLVFLALIVAALFTGCSGKTKEEKVDESAYGRIQKQLMNTTSYESEAAVKYISNKNSNEYETLQQCKITGEYRVEVVGPEKVAGNITIFDGTTISQFNKRISGKISVGSKESQERSEIFLTSFIKNYVKSHEVSVTAANMGEGKATVLEAVIPGEHPYLAKEKLWVDNKTLKPIQLVIYDPDGSERIVITYKTFTYNVSFEEEVFKISL